jgi:type I restriction enzyme S subunit
LTGTGEKTAGAARRVEQDFAGAGVDSIGHEGGESAWRVIFACIPGRLQVNGEVTLSDAVYVSDAVAKTVTPEVWIPPDALLIAMSGATTGKTAFNRTGSPLLLNQRVGRIEIFLVSVHFIRFFFETIIARNLSISFGTAIPNLSVEQINGTVVPIPPLAEQHRIVAKVDELMALCDRLEASLVTGDDTRRRLLDALLAEALIPVDAYDREAAE